MRMVLHPHTSLLYIHGLGCSCPAAIIYGFEVMCSRESARHFHHFLTCRKINFQKLKGCIEDYACGLHPFILNRDPHDFKYKMFLVDGSHWNGQRRLKKGDLNGKGGHLGCPSSYNFNAYKEFSNVKLNSQGREQVNSLIEKCASTLRLKTYHNLMRYIIFFFSVRNIMSILKHKK